MSTPDSRYICRCFFRSTHWGIWKGSGEAESEESLARFLKIADWLTENQDAKGIWLNPLPNRKFGLLKPFPSAMIQGLAISCLCRAGEITGDDRYRHSAQAALSAFGKEIRSGGVATTTGDRVFYEEYPSAACPHVLNGFLYSMWGLWDMARAGNIEAAQRYQEGFTSFIEWLPRYDMGYWSRYHLSNGPDNPATLHYHRLHIDQLTVMYQISGNEKVLEVRDRWLGYLEHRWNPLRTLPSKLRWRFFYSGVAES